MGRLHGAGNARKVTPANGWKPPIGHGRREEQRPDRMRGHSHSSEAAGGQVANSTKGNDVGCSAEIGENGCLLVSCSSLIPTPLSGAVDRTSTAPVTSPTLPSVAGWGWFGDTEGVSSIPDCGTSTRERILGRRRLLPADSVFPCRVHRGEAGRLAAASHLCRLSFRAFAKILGRARWEGPPIPS